ncbi:MAG: undecaprenyl-phosphate glucose phosphotransferase [Planctomycetota bacterium]
MTEATARAEHGDVLPTSSDYPMPHRISDGRAWSDFLKPALDAASILASLVFTKSFFDGPIDEASLPLGLVAVVSFFLAGQLTGLYRRDTSSSEEELRGIFLSWLLTIAVLGVLSFISRYGADLSRATVTCWIMMAPLLMGVLRLCLRALQAGMYRRGVGVRSVAIVGYNKLGRRIRNNLDDQPILRMRFSGYFDDRSPERLRRDLSVSDPSAELLDDEIKGNLQSLIGSARRGEIETILVTLPMRAENRIRFLLEELSDSTVSVYIVPDFFVFELLHSRWTQIGGLPVVSVFESPLFGIDGGAKRVLDLALATIGLLALAIPMTIIGLLIKITSPGPIFFLQRRYGLDGQEIRVWKFRSMRTCDDGVVVKQATKGDPRITRIGGILRKTSLDELPQLINVIDGSMSLVGPRPHASAHNEQYRGLIRGYMLRHKVKPGITGLAQVNGCRGETETLDKMRRRVDYDHQYIRSWSIWLDIRILLKTLLVTWKQSEAY